MKSVRKLVVVVVVLGAILGLAQPAGAATTITASASSTRIDPGRTTYVQGTVTRASATPSVTVQRRVGGVWYDGASGPVNQSTGSFRIAIRPGQSGTFALRVRSARGNIVSNVFYVKVWSITRLYDLNAATYQWDRRSEVMNAVTYPYSLTRNQCITCDRTRFTEYNLNRTYARFNTMIGVADRDASTAAVNYRVLGDGVELAAGRATFGAPRAISVGTRGVLRLRIEVQITTYSNAVLGNPALRR